jgi:hypothetical protein
MEESLIQKAPKGEIGIPKVTETEFTSWNLFGGAMLIGCWFGFCLVPLIHISKPK